MHRIKRKSVYDKKYHIHNKINTLIERNGLKLTYKDQHKVIKIFKEIDNVLPKINKSRKRIININFILKNILMMIDLSCEIPVSKSKKTL